MYLWFYSSILPARSQVSSDLVHHLSPFGPRAARCRYCSRRRGSEAWVENGSMNCRTFSFTHSMKHFRESAFEHFTGFVRHLFCNMISNFLWFLKIGALSGCAVRGLYTWRLNHKMPGVMTRSKINGGDTIPEFSLAVAMIVYLFFKEIRLWYQLLKKR